MISPRLLKTWGTMLISVFVVSSILFALLGAPRAITGGRPVLGWIDAVIAGAAFAISTSPVAFVLCAIRPGSKVGRRFDDSKCLNCDYDLTGLSSDRCPECGRVLDPERTDTRPD